MKRVFMGALCCAALFALSHARAQALLEFCPATLKTQAVGDAATQTVGKAAALYGFNLSAMGPRSVAATLAFDTSAGWFEVEVPQIALVEKDRHYTSISASFVRRDFVSPIMYVRFPAAVELKHSWVHTAVAQDDGPFGWSKQGQVTCDPVAGAGAVHSEKGQSPPELDPKDEDRLYEPPTADSRIFAAKETAAVEDAAGCAVPFGYAMATEPDVPNYPDFLRGVDTGLLTTSIEVAIDANGNVADAWVWGPSGQRLADDASLRAAKGSKYKAGRAYCRNVSGLYMFRVTFSPYH